MQGRGPPGTGLKITTSGDAFKSRVFSDQWPSPKHIKFTMISTERKAKNRHIWEAHYGLINDFNAVSIIIINCCWLIVLTDHFTIKIFFSYIFRAVQLIWAEICSCSRSKIFDLEHVLLKMISVCNVGKISSTAQ